MSEAEAAAPGSEISLETRIGTITLSWSAQGLLREMKWSSAESESQVPAVRAPVPPAIYSILVRLHSYFESGHPLGEIPWEAIDMEGWTPFQRKVYEAISKIPHGQTRTYGWVASRAGSPFASRAVGQALKRNPLLILVPCHRVIPTQGGLGGFMGESDPKQPELMLKQRLLKLEETYLNPVFSFLIPIGSESHSIGAIA